MNRQAGQAIVETAVLAAAFAVLLAALPLTSMLHDVQRTALQSARDAVRLTDWDRGRSARDIWSAPLGTSVDTLPWRHPGDGSRVVLPFAGASVEIGDTAPPGHAARMLEFIAEPLQSGGFRSARFALTSQGLRNAKVTLRVPPVRGAVAPFDALDLEFEQTSASLTDAWNAGGSAHVRERVSGLVPTARLAAIAAPVQAVASLVAFVEPAFRQLCFGYLDVEQVPRRRLEVAPLTTTHRFDPGSCP